MKAVPLLIIMLAFKNTPLQSAKSRIPAMPNKFALKMDISKEIQDMHIREVTMEEHGHVFNASLIETSGALFSAPVPPAVKVLYQLYTSRNLEKPENLTAENLKNSCLNLKQALKVITHGWRQSGAAENILNVKNEYLKHENVNVIIVDWSSVAGDIFYPEVVVYTKDVGHAIGEFITKLIEFGFDSKNMHLIGFSLGAHVSGFATEKISQKIPRITGLDPAYPGYGNGRLKIFGGEGRLSTKHADFVDIIHTNAGVLGIPFPIGNVDFFANGGNDQPGCQQILHYSCSHSRALQYFAESIRNSTFLAKPCNGSGTDAILMGDPAPISANGSYCLATHSGYPFGERKNTR